MSLSVVKMASILPVMGLLMSKRDLVMMGAGGVCTSSSVSSVCSCEFILLGCFVFFGVCIFCLAFVVSILSVDKSTSSLLSALGLSSVGLT